MIHGGQNSFNGKYMPSSNSQVPFLDVENISNFPIAIADYGGA